MLKDRVYLENITFAKGTVHYVIFFLKKRIMVPFYFFPTATKSNKRVPKGLENLKPKLWTIVLDAFNM